MKQEQREPIINPFTILIDSREQAPYQFRGFRTDASSRWGRQPLLIPTNVVGLPTGDYSILDHHNRVAIERKSLVDLYGTLGQGRERFERELERLNSLELAAVVIESSWPDALSRPCPTCSTNFKLCADECQVCHGSGKVHPVDHSRLNPKTVFRSINAWEIRYPKIHWHMMGARELAEHKVFRLLERWWMEVGGVGSVGQPTSKNDARSLAVAAVTK